jgi:ligand-binding SRPBCC domain-containing protein
MTYRLRVHGIPMTWISRITEWVPGERFVDLQLKGPYSYWHHRHIFEDQDGGTLIRDIVDFQLPFGKFGSWLGSSMVESDIQNIFQYRSQITEKLLSLPDPEVNEFTYLKPFRSPVTWH